MIVEKLQEDFPEDKRDSKWNSVLYGGQFQMQQESNNMGSEDVYSSEDEVMISEANQVVSTV